MLYGWIQTGNQAYSGSCVGMSRQGTALRGSFFIKYQTSLYLFLHKHTVLQFILQKIVNIQHSFQIPGLMESHAKLTRIMETYK